MALLALGWLCPSFSGHAASDLAIKSFLPFVDEHLEFSMRYKGINAASSTMWLERSDSLLKITWRIKTKRLASLLFRVDNRYISWLDLDSGRLVQTEKSVDQKNIRQHWQVSYDWQERKAHATNGLNWMVRPGCLDVLSMLYYLRGLGPDAEEVPNFLLDIESQLWHVSVDADPPQVLETFSRPARRYAFDFHPAQNITRRDWKTDILTNRIAREGGRLQVWLSEDDERLPLLLKFGRGASALEMKLERVSRDHSTP